MRCINLCGWLALSSIPHSYIAVQAEKEISGLCKFSRDD